MRHRQPRVICLLTFVSLVSGSAFAATTTTTPHKKHKRRTAHSVAGAKKCNFHRESPSSCQPSFNVAEETLRQQSVDIAHLRQFHRR